MRNDALDRVLIGLDFFDASINRVAAWVVGTRSAQKALLFALLQPDEKSRQLQDGANFTEKMVLMEKRRRFPSVTSGQNTAAGRACPQTEIGMPR